LDDGSDEALAALLRDFLRHGDHILGGPPASPEEDGDRFVRELWNLVIHAIRNSSRLAAARQLRTNPFDKGHGECERLRRCCKATNDTYATRLMRNLIEASENACPLKTPTVPGKTPNRCDPRMHLRSTSFLIADGVMRFE